MLDTSFLFPNEINIFIIDLCFISRHWNRYKLLLEFESLGIHSCKIHLNWFILWIHFFCPIIIYYGSTLIFGIYFQIQWTPTLPLVNALATYWKNWNRSVLLSSIRWIRIITMIIIIIIHFFVCWVVFKTKLIN